MVTQSDTAKLLKIIRNLTYVNINCKLATSNYQLKIAPRNKEGNILHALSEAVNIGNWIFDSDHELHHILNEISRWVQVILLNYRENFLEIGKKYNLDFNDAEKLEFESNKWITEILSFYERSITKMVGEMTLWRTYDELILKIDNESKQELEEALLALLSGLPTASIMLMNRVAEDQVKKFYIKIAGKEPPENAVWGYYEKELENYLDKEDPILGLLKFRRSGRNEAQHPGKKYDSTYVEKFMMKLLELVEEIESRT